MHRYSEIPNTPTPFSKNITASSDRLAIGSIFTIPNTGKAVLRYVGNVEGKKGTFAGMELLGEGASLGKNSGDVNGVQYFTTNKPGAGLFMTYDKLVASLENVESSAHKRISIVNSPAFKANQTPRQIYADKFDSSLSPALNTTRKSRPMVNRYHNSTPPSVVSLSAQSTKSSPGEKDLQRLASINAVVETERNALAKECDDLKRQIIELKATVDENKGLILDLQNSYEENRAKLKKANEHARDAENKLLKQRKVYEEQRNELLEVIDQVETQVNENEQLYIGELKKLQQELTQKQEIIEDLKKEHRDIQELYNKQKNSLDSSSQFTSDAAQTEINNLRLTNSTQIKAIEQLREELKSKEGRIIEMNKSSLALKEEHISESDSLSSELRRQIEKVEDYKRLAEDKEKEIIQLREEISKFSENLDDNSSKEVIESMAKELTDLRERATEISKYESQVSELRTSNEQLQEKLLSSQKIDNKLTELQATLEKKDKLIENLKQSMLENDKVIELEFKLETKEKFIEDLKAQIVAGTLTAAEEENHTDIVGTKEISCLKEILQRKEYEIESLNKQLHALKTQEDAHIMMECKLKEKDSLIKDQETRLTKFNNELNEAGKFNDLLEEKQNEVSSLREEISSLKCELASIDKFKGELDAITKEKEEFVQMLTAKDVEFDQLREKLRELIRDNEKMKKELEVERKNNSEESEVSEKLTNTGLLEEKELEIELLQEEIIQLKSNDFQQEILRLKADLKKAKHLTSSSTNLELNNQISLLKQDLESRPTVAEMQELRSELELIDELRRVENKSKDREIEELKVKLRTLSESISDVSVPKAAQIDDLDRNHTDNKRRPSVLNDRSSMNRISLNRPSSVSRVVDGNLLVYIPEKKDPANGRALWCGLCEQDGHDSIDCPYENDIF